MIAINRKGFSLVEMMIVVALIGILSTIAIPMWNRYRQNTDLKTAAREIAGDMFNMKQRATGELTRFQITFDVGNNRYQLINASTGNVIQTKSLSEFGWGIELTGANFEGDATIDFLTRGTTDWGSVSLKNALESTAIITANSVGRTHVSFKMQ